MRKDIKSITKSEKTAYCYTGRFFRTPDLRSSFLSLLFRFAQADIKGVNMKYFYHM